MGALTDQVVARAREQGFVAAGVASAAASETMPRYRRWLEQGYAAGMQYMARHADLREDPRLLAPGTVSVLVVAARYPANRARCGGFSAFACGLDYHDVIRGKLRQLAEFIGARAPLKVARICVDSAPLLEREWAVRAGVGWRGRQGQIVNPDAGCCILLGALLVDAPLDPSVRCADQCGTCRRCLDACPTGALCEDGSVDARKCISYLTVEHKGEFQMPVPGAMKGRLFGCDECTGVCPWNERGEDRVMPEFSPAPMPGAAEILEMSEEEFVRRFSGTAVFRTGLGRLQRNARAWADQALQVQSRQSE
jgi:epoxyqueuosine reductase